MFQELTPRCRRQPEAAWARQACWMFTAVLPTGVDRDRTAQALAGAGIETRPVFPPMHTLPPYQHLAAAGSLPVAEDLSPRGLNLPTGAHLSVAEVEFVADAPRAAVRTASGADL